MSYICDQCNKAVPDRTACQIVPVEYTEPQDHYMTVYAQDYEGRRTGETTKKFTGRGVQIRREMKLCPACKEGLNA